MNHSDIEMEYIPIGDYWQFHVGGDLFKVYESPDSGAVFSINKLWWNVPDRTFQDRHDVFKWALENVA